MTLEEIRKRKKEHGYSNEQMACLSGLPLETVKEILDGTANAPGYETILALASVFPQEGFLHGGSLSVFKAQASMLQEAQAAYAVQRGQAVVETDGRYPRQGSYTIDDYLTLPDDQRGELIDGIIYDMGAPTLLHQLIGGEIFACLREFILKRQGSCIPFIAPVDVQLDCENRTMIQPDVGVVCDRSKLNRMRVYGAPDFVVEVFSPSTKIKDIMIKLPKYQKAGVREYWMVDPDQQLVIKVLFSSPSEEYPEGDIKLETVPFSQPVPVGIFDGECRINFSEIVERYDFMF